MCLEFCFELHVWANPQSQQEKQKLSFTSDAENVRWCWFKANINLPRFAWHWAKVHSTGWWTLANLSKNLLCVLSLYCDLKSAEFHVGLMCSFGRLKGTNPGKDWYYCICTKDWGSCTLSLLALLDAKTGQWCWYSQYDFKENKHSKLASCILVSGESVVWALGDAVALRHK